MSYLYEMHFLVWSFLQLLLKQKTTNLYFYQQPFPTSLTGTEFYHLSLYLLIKYVLNDPFQLVSFGFL